MFVKTTLVVAIAAALSVWVALWPHERQPTTAAVTASAGRALDATSDAEARQMRRVTSGLAREAAAVARCDPALRPTRYAACVVAPLRHLGMGGTMAARALNIVIAAVPTGRCKAYLLGLQAGAQAAGDQARWLLPRLYVRDRAAAQHAVAGQIVLALRMLRRVVGAAPAAVCSPTAGGPAI